MSNLTEFRRGIRVPVPPECVVKFRGSTTGKFDGTGLGIVGTDYEGWALCNGNNGTIDLRDFTGGEKIYFVDLDHICQLLMIVDFNASTVRRSVENEGAHQSL